MKKILKITVYFHILIFTIFVNKSLAREVIEDDSVRKYVYEGYEHLYNFEFKQAKSNINYLKSNYKDSPWPYVLSANYYWYLYLTGENEAKVIPLFYKELDAALERSIDKSDYESKFCIALIVAFKSRLDLMEGKYITALKSLIKEINLITSTMGIENKYKGYYLTSGLYYYLNAAAYRDYKILRPMLFLIPKGNLEKGIKFLKMDKKDIILDCESEYFLLKIYFDVEHDYEQAEHYGKILATKYPKNFIFKHLYYKSYQKSKKTKLSLQFVDNFEKKMLENDELSTDQRTYIINIIKKNYRD